MVRIIQGSNLVDTDTVILGEGKNSWLPIIIKMAYLAYLISMRFWAYEKRSGITYYSAASQCADNYNPNGSFLVHDWMPTSYPSPLAPDSLFATDGTYDSYVKLTWIYAAESEITGFELYKNNVKIGEVAKGMREYNHLEFIATTPFRYVRIGK